MARMPRIRAQATVVMVISFFYIEHILRLTALIIPKGFLLGHTLRLRLQYQPHGLAIFTVVERIGGFTAHMEQ